MLKQILTLSLCALIAAAPLEAKSRKSSRKKTQTAQTAEKPKESAYDKLFKKKHDVADGMIKLHKVGDKLYFEFPQALFGREMLLGWQISETWDNLTGVPGSKSYVPLHITFTKTGENVQIREINADPKNKNAQDVMMSPPSEVTQKQLDELHIQITKHEE